MMLTAPFTISRWEPQASDSPQAGPSLSRVVIGKQFTGALHGTSEGEGLFCGMDAPQDGAGYLVSERFVGSLSGRSGSFVLQHGGAMGPGVAPHTFGRIVPGSGTGDLAGIAGTVEIVQDAEGEHTLALDYTLGG